MNSAHALRLLDLAGGNTMPVGNLLGRAVLTRLLSELERRPAFSIVEVSLAGITATDASFPRESVVSVAKLISGEKGLFLSGFSNQDLVDNWDYAAKAKDQAISVEGTDGKYSTIGPELTAGLREVFDLAVQEQTVATSKVAQVFDISAQNASAKLKKLAQMGLLLGKKETAETGGLEYIYRAARRI